MQESGAPSDKLPGGGTLRSPFLKKLENFWYHYKWQTIIGGFLLLVLIICLVQCAGNGRGDDAYLLYGGEYVLSTTGLNDMERAVASYVTDRNGDGKIVVAIGAYTVRTAADIRGQHPSNQAYYAQASYDQLNKFDQEILSGEATLCLLSPALFERVAEAGGFLPVAEYYTGIAYAGSEVSYGGVAYGIPLRLTSLGNAPGFSSLPEDTVLCVRRVSTMSSLFGRDEAEALHAASLVIVGKILAAPHAE